MRRLASIALVAALVACGSSGGGKAGWTAASAGMQGASSGSDVERFFPLIDGRVYHYTRLEEDTGGQGLLVARVFRADATHGELRFPAGVKHFEYKPDGVLLLPAGAYVLKGPLAVGTAWRGEHGGSASIIAIDVAVDVPAGHFTGCLQTLEEVRGDRRVRYATTFCPDTGVVVLEAASGANLERAELKSYGAPVQIGPDGLQRIQ